MSTENFKTGKGGGISLVTSGEYFCQIAQQKTQSMTVSNMQYGHEG